VCDIQSINNDFQLNIKKSFCNSVVPSDDGNFHTGIAVYSGESRGSNKVNFQRMFCYHDDLSEQVKILSFVLMS
jgi:hypothetical protein